jgi:anti-sigma28 factor (negative regulator of flagellin synthesis)
MNIQGLTPQQIAPAALNPEARKAVAPEKGGEAKRRDPVELSAKGVESQKSSPAMAATLRANALPETREEKIELAKKRVEEGYYDRPEVMDDLADNLGETIASKGRPARK